MGTRRLILKSRRAKVIKAAATAVDAGEFLGDRSSTANLSQYQVGIVNNQTT